MTEQTTVQEENNEEKETTIWLEIIKFQLLWYLFNFLILFLEQNLAFDLPILDNFYLISFKVVGRSLFIAFFLYWALMEYGLNFKDLGITFKDLFANLKLGLMVSWPLLLGIIFSHLHLNNLNTLITIDTIEDLSTSLIYYVIIFFGCLIPAFSTELFYRGFIFKQLKENHCYLIAFILSTSFYTLIHLDFRSHIMLLHFIMAFITTYLYHKTDSLLAPTIFQATYQASLTTFLFAFTGWPF
ncbi:CPBP family intramembrane glutamic endopeptidase [Halanaerobacter jeridensis]|uniref:Membrane protease YdiL (CAAX protease family) n=1 Tax=Halanaerobacter jeridensis TaxID=706427 RepID=A0A938XUF5_9FIRM|nr:type II CAAX endopeptidase family protein [Halanaerobacter jeridensis]MBM7557986.1 membrane protease YdiL (CAAX protease family) [Halanaerobacter jeridensis]